jgi:hypothetical protein
MTVDGNKNMFSIVFDVVEVQWKDSWMFFLSLLGDALHLILNCKISM